MLSEWPLCRGVCFYARLGSGIRIGNSVRFTQCLKDTTGKKKPLHGQKLQKLLQPNETAGLVERRHTLLNL